eukprot:c8098_g1_i1.p1 GENE.c8098_g1_i1~~c8098_g1_i1.p1  ORF type:complete len:268 (-),score=78.55 c8098_g1_i1:12-815(-)
MTKDNSVLSEKEQDFQKLLACGTHLGTKCCDHQMAPYVWKRRADGLNILNLGKTYENLKVVARIIVAIENPADVCVVAARTYAQRPILKFAQHTGAQSIAGRFTPGTFTNQLQKAFKEPRLVIVTDPRIDHQAVTEASMSNIPVVALCDSDTPLSGIDIVVPCNNKGKLSLGLLFWLLSREVLKMRGTVNAANPWTEMVDLFFYRDPEDLEKSEADVEETKGGEWGAEAAAPQASSNEWGATEWGNTDDWGAQGNSSADAGTGWDTV